MTSNIKFVKQGLIGMLVAIFALVVIGVIAVSAINYVYSCGTGGPFVHCGADIDKAQNVALFVIGALLLFHKRWRS